MKKQLSRILALFLLGILLPITAFSAVTNPQVVTDMLNRIGGTGTAARFVTIQDETLASGGKEVFVITSQDGKPCIKGSNILAITTGVNWYLNHVAHINLTWNRLTTDLTSATLPVPTTAETHTANGDYRYYLNYCTFSYSMANWTWERWQKEIDWMALHGINMPLQLVGTDVVWKKVLTQLGYTSSEANSFIAGPAFQAWWLMSNLASGWGGPNPDWWYTRQEKLCKRILAAERAFGMKPVLPGYAGMAPTDLATKKTAWAADVISTGGWCGFSRPYILNPSSTSFTEMSKIYYDKLTEVMGTSKFYSMDLFHEGSVPSSLNTTDLKNACFSNTVKAMDTNVGDTTKWIIQNWGNNPLKECLNTVPKGRLVVLDLFAEEIPHWSSWAGLGGSFGGHETVFCMLHNFGGRIGLHGRFNDTKDGYYKAIAAYPATIKGVGTTAEGIETNPVLYDMLYELPWVSSFNTDDWMKNYAKARYSTDAVDEHLYPAWNTLLNTVYSCPTTQHGTSEPIMTARPGLHLKHVSYWATTSSIYWEPEDLRMVVNNLLEAKTEALKNNPNYQYDLVDCSRQTLNDYALTLLAQIDTAADSSRTARFKALSDRMLQLVLDQNEQLNTCPDFMVGSWSEGAASIVDEADGVSAGAPASDKQWLRNNVRRLISVWGPIGAANGGGLRDYANREWGGILKDMHYARWKKFYDAKNAGTSVPTATEYFNLEDAWATSTTVYPTTAQGDFYTTVQSKFKKYFGKLTIDGDLKAIYAYNAPETRATLAKVYAGNNVVFTADIVDAASTPSLYVDLNGDGIYTENEKATMAGDGLTKTFTLAIPADAQKAIVNAKLEETPLVSTDAPTALGFKLSINTGTPVNESITNIGTPYGNATASTTIDIPDGQTVFITGGRTDVATTNKYLGYDGTNVVVNTSYTPSVGSDDFTYVWVVKKSGNGYQLLPYHYQDLGITNTASGSAVTVGTTPGVVNIGSVDANTCYIAQDGSKTLGIQITTNGTEHIWFNRGAGIIGGPNFKLKIIPVTVTSEAISTYTGTIKMVNSADQSAIGTTSTVKLNAGSPYAFLTSYTDGTNTYKIDRITVDGTAVTTATITPSADFSVIYYLTKKDASVYTGTLTITDEDGNVIKQDSALSIPAGGSYTVPASLICNGKTYTVISGSLGVMPITVGSVNTVEDNFKITLLCKLSINTGVSAISTSLKAKTYDLNGRRVPNSTKGFVVRKGSKVIH